MNKILFTLASMTVLSTAFASQALATPRTGYSSHSSHVSSSRYHAPSYVSHSKYANYHVNHGKRFAHGFYYVGRQHNHWTYTRYDSRYGCTCYYDSGCSTWYYWCAPDSCYYPVTHRPYRTYCWGSGTCDSVRPAILPSAPIGQVRVAPVGPGPNGPPVTGTQTDDGPPIPAPVGPPRE